MGKLETMTLMMLVLFSFFHANANGTTADQRVRGEEESKPNNRRVIDVKGGPDSVVWVVQLSDLHFSVHYPERALQFKEFVGPALSMINPSLVLITGDLTDGKSMDLLTMKLNEKEWLEYHNVMQDVVKRSGLDESIFFDLRGNHDNFGVPAHGGPLDYFSKYSINGQLGRSTNINSVTLRTAEHKHLFVGVDITMSVGLRGPTNLFGHPTDQLLDELDMELSQWDSHSTKPITKIAFGHFPLSFSAASYSGKSLKDVFLNHSLSAYLCGHLHTWFGKNLKRHHQLDGHRFPSLQKFFQFNPHEVSYNDIVNCSIGTAPIKEFWEWEMGDWRKSRAMRILAIDRGHVSYVDIDFRLGVKKTIILPTFPLDSRFMSTSSSHHKYECQVMIPYSYETIRALVFSVSPIVSVIARIYDLRPGNLNLVVEAPMGKIEENNSRGNLYVAPWNYGAFEDPAPDRYWLQIEAIDFMGRSTLTDLRPFSINGLNAKVSWTWTEFKVMGCHWAALYYPILWSALYFILSLLIIPKALLIFSNKRLTYKDFVAHKSLQNCVGWVLQELCKVPIVWFGMLGYLFYLLSFPWFVGKVFIDGKDTGYMTYMGWAVRSFNESEKHEYLGFPDIMVVVIPHLFYVVMPSILVAGFLAAEKRVYREHFLSATGKKEDDKSREEISNSCIGMRWIRKVLLVVCLAICWKHFMDDGILVVPTTADPPLKLCAKKGFLSEFLDRVFALTSIASMSGCCQVTIPMGKRNDSPISISLMSFHGADKFLLDTVLDMYSCLQEQVSVASDLLPLPDTNGSLDASELLKEKGNAAFKGKQWNKAVNYYTEAIKLNRANATYYSNRAAAYLELGCFQQAEEDCSKALELDKKNVKAYLRRGTARESLIRYKGAVQDFKHALVLEPYNKVANLAEKRLRKLMS